MAFSLRFVGSEVRSVVLDGEDAKKLLVALDERFDEYTLGLPDLVGRLKDGGKEGEEITIDEAQADELLAALRAIRIANEDNFSDRLAHLQAACVNYRSSSATQP
jgi:hypothetical protein